MSKIKKPIATTFLAEIQECIYYNKSVSKAEKINYPHIKCLKRCDDNRCDCIKDFIEFLERRKK